MPIPSLDTFGDALVSWIAFSSRSWTTAKSGDGPRRMVRDWTRVLGSMPIRSVRPGHIQAIYLDQDNGRRSAIWLNKQRDRLHAFFGWAIGLGLCRANPVTPAAWPRKPVDQGSSRSRTRVRVTSELLERILDLAPPRYGRLLVFLFLAGLRIGEALAASWSWVVPDPRDPSAWILAVPPRRPQDRRKQARGYVIPLGSRAMAVLGERGSDGSRLFPEAPTASAVRAILSRIGDRLGIKGLSPHQFRRSCSTVLVDEGMPLPAAQQFMGWRCAPKAWLDELAGSYYLGLEGSRARAIQDRLWPDRH